MTTIQSSFLSQIFTVRAFKLTGNRPTDLPDSALKQALELNHQETSPYHRSMMLLLLTSSMREKYALQLEYRLYQTYGSSYNRYSKEATHILTLLSNAGVASYAFKFKELLLGDFDELSLQAIMKGLSDDSLCFPELFNNILLPEKYRCYLINKLEIECDDTLLYYSRLVLASTELDPRYLDPRTEAYADSDDLKSLLVKTLRGQSYEMDDALVGESYEMDDAFALQSRYYGELKMMEYYLRVNRLL